MKVDNDRNHVENLMGGVNSTFLRAQNATMTFRKTERVGVAPRDGPENRMTSAILKMHTIDAENLMGTDVMFRRLTTDKIITILGHGMKAQTYEPPIWARMPVPTFQNKLRFLYEHRRIIHANDVMAPIRSGTFPPILTAPIFFEKQPEIPSLKWGNAYQHY